MSLRLGARAPDQSREGPLQRGEAAAWDELVKREHGRLFNLHLRLTGDREAAADLTQETFVAAYQGVTGYAGRAAFEAWLYGVALNCHRNWRRRQGLAEVAEEPAEDLPDPAPTAAQVAMLHERSAVVVRAVQRLPESYRRAVALRYFAGVPAVEIAREEGVDAGTVRWRLHHALQRLWVMLQPELGKEEAQ